MNYYHMPYERAGKPRSKFEDCMRYNKLPDKSVRPSSENLVQVFDNKRSYDIGNIRIQTSAAFTFSGVFDRELLSTDLAGAGSEYRSQEIEMPITTRIATTPANMPATILVTLLVSWKQRKAKAVAKAITLGRNQLELFLPASTLEECLRPHKKNIGKTVYNSSSFYAD